MGRLDGKVAIITGGNSGVGAATAIKFAAEGAKVVITARREAPLLEVAEKIRAAGGEVLPVASDISKAEDAKKMQHLPLLVFTAAVLRAHNAPRSGGGRRFTPRRAPAGTAGFQCRTPPATMRRLRCTPCNRSTTAR